MRHYSLIHAIQKDDPMKPGISPLQPEHGGIAMDGSPFHNDLAVHDQLAALVPYLKEIGASGKLPQVHHRLIIRPYYRSAQGIKNLDRPSF